MNRRNSARLRRYRNRIFTYLMLVLVGWVMAYPLLFMFFGTFKSNSELFGSISLLPKTYSMQAYIDGWKGSGQYTYTTFYLNTFKMVIPTVLFTIMSSVLVAYGFSRFRFPGRRILFSLMLATLMLPATVLIIPNFILFKALGFLDSYLPFTIPALFASNSFFIFMASQFFRGVPRELDEAACIDGCNSLQILVQILLPLMKPVLFSIGIFQFIWTWNNFLNALIYINDVRKYPISLALKMAVDTVSGVRWNQVLAMSFVSVVPSVLIFFFAQKYFVEGIATSGIKG